MLHKDLGDLRCRRDEDLRCFVAGVGCPFVRSCKLNDLFPVGNAGQDFERFREFAGLVTREKETNPVVVRQRNNW
jgi:hypothetical protein